MFSNLQDLARELQIISEQLDRLRFAGGDQNPHGIRDTVYACASLAKRLARQEDTQP